MGLFSNADDQGRLRAHPALLRSEIFPYDDIPLDELTEALVKFEQAGSIYYYGNDGKDIIQLVNWWKWNRDMSWARPSKLAPPAGWIDRICYRKGNDVIKSDWDDNWPTIDPTVKEEFPPDDPIVIPERGQNGASAEPAPSSSLSPSPSPSLAKDRQREGADAPAPGKPPPKSRKPAEKPPPAAVQAYRDATHRFPNKSLWSGIVEVVGDDPADVERWGKVCLAYVAMGWNPANVKGMLGFYAKGEIPGDGNGRGARASPQNEPASFAGLREWAEQEGIGYGES